MENTSPAPQESSNVPVQQLPAGLFTAEYTCPICYEVILRISGNMIEYLSSHFDTAQGSTPGYDALAVHHFIGQPHHYDTGDCVPGKMYAPEEPFLVISSTTITPYRGS